MKINTKKNIKIHFEFFKFSKVFSLIHHRSKLFLSNLYKHQNLQQQQLFLSIFQNIFHRSQRFFKVQLNLFFQVVIQLYDE
jgi:hypothetical protein